MKEKLLKSDHSNPMTSKRGRVLFSAIGFAAILILGVLGYLIFSGADRVDQVVISERSVSSNAQIVMRENIQEKLPDQKNKMIIPASSEIQGRWLTTFGASAIAELVMTGEKFEIIYTSDPQGRSRKFSKGVYSYDERTGKITLSPSKKMGQPAPISGVRYGVLTMRQYDMFVSQKQGDNSLYFIAPEYQIISKSFHPLFLYADYAGAPVLEFSPTQINQKEH